MPRRTGGSAELVEDAASPERLAAWLAALANPRRVRLLHFLAAPHSIEEMAAELGIARQNAQAHLQQLQRVGVVHRLDGRGPAARFVVEPSRLFAIQEAMTSLGSLEPQLALGGMPPTLAAAAESAQRGERELPRLVLVRGVRVGRTVTMAGPGPWLIGRAHDAAVCLDYDPFVSARHAEVRRAAGGRFEVADLYSRNGTYREWERLPRGGAMPLSNGDVVRAGKTLLLFRQPA